MTARLLIVLGLLVGHSCDPAPAPAPPVPVEHADPVAYVNGLVYGWQDMGPAMDAYRVVAAVRGWSPADVEAWAPFVFDVIVKESGGCWNLKGGQVPTVGDCFTFQTNPRHPRTDSGFGQVTPVLDRGARAPLCKGAGLCSQADVIASPWSSMVALVDTIAGSPEAGVRGAGSFPWCWNAKARRYHACSIAPDRHRP